MALAREPTQATKQQREVQHRQTTPPTDKPMIKAMEILEASVGGWDEEASRVGVSTGSEFGELIAVATH